MSTNLKQFVTDIANAIRSKKGTSELINPQDFANEIKDINASGGTVTNEKLLEVVQRSVQTLTRSNLQGLYYVGNRAFMYCTALTEITLPNSVISIGDRAFMYCSSLTHITIPNGTNLGNLVFSNCTSLETVDISGVASMKDSVFLGCARLQMIAFPENPNITKINDYMCYQCSSLYSVTIPSNITVIGNYAFYDCQSLRDLTIPSSVTNIYSGALRVGNIDTNSKIRFVSSTPPTISSNTFSEYVTIIVPDGAKSAYLNATNWANFADQIKEESEVV